MIGEEEYNKLMKYGWLACDHNHYEVLANKYEQIANSYKWMANQLRKRKDSFIDFFHNRTYMIDSLVYPRWVWYSVDGETNPLLIDKCFFTGIPGIFYFVFLDIPDRRVLLSDYDMWHMCLNNCYIPEDDEDEKAFDEKLASYQISYPQLFDEKFYKEADNETKNAICSLREETVNSWDKIFDLEENAHTKNSDKIIQGVTWILRKEDVEFVKTVTVTQKELDDYDSY